MFAVLKMALVKCLMCFLCVFHVSFADMTQMYIKMGARTVLRIINNTVGDSQCGDDLRLYVDGVLNLKTWALEMLDASDKIAAGYLTGNVRQSGNYDECLDIRTENNSTVIQGKYCLYGILSNITGKENVFNIKKQLSLKGIKVDKVEYYLNGIKATSSLCVPLSCSAADLQIIWDYIQSHYNLNVELRFDENLCDYKGRVHFDKSDILALVFFMAVGVIISLSTLYEVTGNGRLENKYSQFILCFSTLSNSKKLFNLSSNNPLSCLHGIRVISMAWIILCHGYLLNLIIPNINGLYILEWKDNVESMIILGGSMAVDTFLVLSGILVSYTFLTKEEEEGSVNVIVYFLHRILRLTPSLAAILLNLTTLFKFLSAGPYWHIIFRYIEENCDKYWWATVLYIQNYYKPLDQCLPHGWYLSVDMQLYILAPLLLYPMIRWPKKILAAVFVLTLLSMLAAFCNTWIMKFRAMPFEPKDNYFKHMYQATYIRASAWLIGLFAGYVFHRTKDSGVKIPKSINFALWILSILTMACTLFGQITFVREDEYDVLKAAVFNTLARPAWSAALCYIIFACINGYGGFINHFLSLPIFRIISRLTYSMYLMHLGVLGISVNGKRTVTYFNNLTMLHDFWGDYIFTISYAIGWTLTFESPIIAMEKYFKLRTNPNMEKEKEVNTFDLPTKNKQQIE